MNISALSIRRPVFAWMLMFGLIIFGAISFTRMGISQMPDINFPVVNIGLRLDNAAPELMETNVVDIIEDAVMGIEGLKSVVSSVSQGIANITCNFAMSHNVDVALEEVQSRINQSANLLPTALFPPIITKTNPEDQPILWIMVTADAKVPLYEQMIYARNTLKDQLSTLPGVGTVTLAGYVEPNLRVWLNKKALRAYDLNSADVLAAITAEQIEQPAGRIEAPQTESNIRVLGEAKTPADFGKIRISNRGGSPNYDPIALSKVARVEEGLSDIRAMSRYQGRSAVGLGVVKQHGANAVEVARAVRSRVEDLKRSLLPHYQLEVKLDSTKYIQDSVNELNLTLVISALLTSIVCYLFLGSWSATFNVLLAIPTSIVGAFSALYFFGFTLNTFTLLGLSLAIGIVVDDAIMMLENIVRHYEMGKSRRKASLEGSAEITFAAIATTLAIAAIFIPVIFMEGIVGKFFYQYGITVTVAVFLSLLEALTLTPMRCARFMQSAKHGQPGIVLRVMDSLMESLSEGYRRSLRLALRLRYWVIALSVVLFGFSVVLLNLLRQELIPEQDQSLFYLSVKTPVGTSLPETNRVYLAVEQKLQQRPEVLETYSTIGNYQNNNVVNAGVIYVLLKAPEQRGRAVTQRALMEELRTEVTQVVDGLIQGGRVFTQDPSLSGFSASRGFPIEFTLRGPDWENLRQYGLEIEKRLQASGLVVDLNSDYQDNMPQVQIIPDRRRAAERGVAVNTLGTEVSVVIGGQIFNSNTQYPKDNHRYSIRVRSEKPDHAAVASVGQVPLRNNRGVGGELVPLAQTARVVSTRGMQLISRVNRFRAIPYYANVAHGRSQQAALQALEKITAEVLPRGYSVEITGSAEAFREAFRSLIFALILGVAVAYMVLASQFNSFIHPITVLTALPFSLSGALIALYLCHQSLSLFSMIGLILLMGIVKKNSILLVDFTNQQRAQGLDAEEALLHACPVRLRPILMTSVATVVGAIPEALNFGAGAETRVPMAVSIIGGVTLSTLLTLYVVPCVYRVFSRWERPEAEDEELSIGIPA